MIAGLRKQWVAFKGSFDPGEMRQKSSPAQAAIAFVSLGALTLIPAYLAPSASWGRMRDPWLPVLLALTGSLLTLCYWKSKGRATICTLLDTSFYVAWGASSSALTEPPASHAYATVLGLMICSTHAQQFSLTLAFGAAVCLPAIGIVAYGGNIADIFITVSGCILCLIASQHTGLVRKWRDRMQAAIQASDNMSNQGVEMALTTTLLGLGNFLHELRNAEVVVQANLTFLDETDASDPEFRPALRDSIDAQMRVHQLIDRILKDLKNRSNFQQTTFALQEVLDRLRSKHHEPPELVVTPPEHRFLVSGDPDHLRSVFENLLRNAAQAGAKHVAVDCHIDGQANLATIRVHDDGPGIPAHLLPSLFKPFMTSGKRLGSGIGLYLSRRYVELMGGRIEASNDKAHGAVFVVRLPGQIDKAPMPGTVDVLHRVIPKASS